LLRVELSLNFRIDNVVILQLLVGSARRRLVVIAGFTAASFWRLALVWAVIVRIPVTASLPV
jgi:hypothetical protein